MSNVSLLRTLLLTGFAGALALTPLGASAAPDRVDDKKGEDKGEDKKKTGATKDDYTLDTSASTAEIKVNGDGKLSIHIQPVEGLKVHPQAPLEARLTPSSGIKPARTKLGRKQVTDPASTDPELVCDLHAEAAGDHTVEAEVTFFLCSDTWCQRMKDKVTVAVKAVP